MKQTIRKFFDKNKASSKITPIVLVVALIIIGFISFSPSMKKSVSKEKASTIAEEFINSYLMEPGSKASIVSVTEEYGLYKIEVDITSSVVDSYLSKDGKLFFPQALNIEEINAEETPVANEASAPVAEVTNKNDKPVVELFVMSHCPYGTQMEKGILPVVKALGDTVDFQIKFNSYAMHGEVELIEQINQYCIMTEQENVYFDYLNCFLVAGDSSSCLASAKVDTKKMENCFAKTDKDYNIISDFENKVGYQGNYPGFNIYKDDNVKYGVGGSPTLVINGQTISSNRDSASLLYTICSAFNTQPDACFAALSSASPAPGFGTGTTDSAASAECN
ncbi:hypothetical protein GW758_04630 [Candidatus Falkowbacteria bacterium]|nr:hypothetical protein [Candidatus Falkowbacteria bacterium]